MILNVFFSSKLAGFLESTPSKGIVFRYAPDFLADGTSLSLSLPLQNKEFSQQECLPFFSGILPEGDVKRRVSDFLHISESSSFKLLQELGGDCAGMISILPETESVQTQDAYVINEKNYCEISEQDLADYIRNSASRPLLKASDELRLSLAGAQEKLPLAFFDGSFFLPKNGAPSTHIIKPAGVGELSSLAANEFICSQLAKIVGLTTVKSELRQIDGQYFFMTERYDRKTIGKTISRLHQEDLCQALGIMSDRKYQNDGGPSLIDIYNLIKQQTSIPLLNTKMFIQYVLFNLIIGNCDAHGKNYSFLYDARITKLAPIYDTVCTLVYPNLSKKMSMKLGRHYEIKKISQDDLVSWAQEIGLKPSTLLKNFFELKRIIQENFSIVKKEPSLADFSSEAEKIEEIISSSLQH